MSFNLYNHCKIDIYIYNFKKILDHLVAVKMPTIVKHPNKTDYLVGVDTSISLNCKTDGYPKPFFLWYKDNQIDTISTKDIFTITDVTTTNSGKYTCFVSNTFNGVIHTKRVQVYVSIINDGKFSLYLSYIIIFDKIMLSHYNFLMLPIRKNQFERRVISTIFEIMTTELFSSLNKWFNF